MATNSRSARARICFGVDAGLPFEGKGFDRPRLGQSRLFDPPRERRLLPMMVLRAQESGEEGAVRELVLLGMRQLVVDDRRDLLEMEIAGAVARSRRS